VSGSPVKGGRAVGRAGPWYGRRRLFGRSWYASGLPSLLDEGRRTTFNRSEILVSVIVVGAAGHNGRLVAHRADLLAAA